MRGKQDLGQCEGWYTFNAHPTPGPTATIRRYRVSAAVALDASLSFQEWTISPGDVGGSTDIWFGGAVAYDEDDDSIILMVDTDGASVRRLDPERNGVSTTSACRGRRPGRCIPRRTARRRRRASKKNSRR